MKECTLRAEGIRVSFREKDSSHPFRYDLLALFAGTDLPPFVPRRRDGNQPKAFFD